MHPFQKEVKERADQIDLLINSIDDNNLDLRNDVAEIEGDLEKLEAANPGQRAGNSVPGEKVDRLLNEWADEDVYADEDMKKYTTELWVSLEEFEKQLKNEEGGQSIVFGRQVKRYEAQIQRLKNLHLFE